MTHGFDKIRCHKFGLSELKESIEFDIFLTMSSNASISDDQRSVTAKLYLFVELAAFLTILTNTHGTSNALCGFRPTLQ
jgi:hypothetical protein